MGPNKPTDLTLGKLVFLVLLCTIATHVGPIIGGIIGVVLVLLVIVLTVIGVIYYRRHKVHKHTRLPHAEHYREYNQERIRGRSVQLIQLSEPKVRRVRCKNLPYKEGFCRPHKTAIVALA